MLYAFGDTLYFKKINGCLVFSITKYDVERNFKGLDKKDPNLDLRINGFLDDMIIAGMAELYNYGNDNRVINEAEQAGRYMLTAKGGPFYKRLTSNNRLTSQEKTNILCRFSKKIFITYIISSDSINANPSLFNDHDAIKKQMVFSWPSYDFWENQDSIFNLNQGEVISVNKGPERVILRADSIKYSPVITDTSYLKLYYNFEEYRKVNEYGMNTFKAARMDVDLKFVNQIFSDERADSLSTAEINLKIWNDWSAKKLFSFYFDGKKQEVSFAELLNYYNKLPVKNAVVDKNKFLSLIKNYVFAFYSLKEAIKYGCDKDKEFLTKKQNFTKRVIVNYFVNDSLSIKHGSLNNDLLYSYYLKNISQYVNTLKDSIIFFFFKTPTRANNFCISKETNRFNDADSIRTFLNAASIKYTLQNEDRVKIKTLPVNEFLNPIKIGKNYAVIQKVNSDDRSNYVKQYKSICYSYIQSKILENKSKYSASTALKYGIKMDELKSLIKKYMLDFNSTVN